MSSRLHPRTKAAIDGLVRNPQGSWLFTGSSPDSDLISSLITSLHGHASPAPDCRLCRQIALGIHPDFKRIEPTDSGSIGIAQVHALNQTLSASKYDIETPYRVSVINQAEKLTTEAQNALLKLLEEPPKDAVIILITQDSSKLLDTVKSRCRTLIFYGTETAAQDFDASILESDTFSQLVKSGQIDAEYAKSFVEAAGLALTGKHRTNFPGTKNLAQTQLALEQLQRNLNQNVSPKAAMTAFFLELP